MENSIAIGGGRKRDEVAPSDPAHTRRQRKENENEKETIVLDATDLLPLEIWCHIVWRVPDASTFFAFARTCLTFGCAAHGVQDVMKDAFSHIQTGSSLGFTWTAFVLPSGQRHGEYEELHVNGNIFHEGIYRDGKQEGKWITWHDNREKRSEETYRDGQQEGKWTQWHDNREKESEGIYHNGYREGKWTQWHYNGQMACEETYCGGLQEGKWTIWYTNGKIHSEGMC